jgi:hypothetical protein
MLPAASQWEPAVFRIVCSAVVCALAVLTGPVVAEDEGLSEQEIQRAVERSLPLLVAGAKGVLDHPRKCFMCHNQALPVLAITTAESRGFEADRDHLARQMRHTAEFLKRNRERYLKGEGQGGQVDMAGYALWQLSLGDWPRDEVTSAVVEYFLQYQSDRDHWDSISDRPPSEKSSFTATYLALRGLAAYGGQRERIELRRTQVRDWLIRTPAIDTEDRVFRLRGLAAAGASSEQVTQAARELIGTQRPDGGWSQDADRESDAYATGSALVALFETSSVAVESDTFRRGLRFLIDDQLPDGSWHVVSHSKPFQTYFESGYPHGADQFISCAAAGWATTALALALPERPPAPPLASESD